MLPYLWKSLRSILIAPGYEVYSQMGIYQRDLSSFDEYSIIDNSETYGMCVNCHTSNRTNPNQFVFHVRGDHGATMIQQSDRREWLKAQNETLGGAMVYPYWHPSGQYCAFSTNQTRQGFHITDQKRIEVFDLSSDVFVYHPATHEIISDSLLSTKDWSENCPVFSPDDKKHFSIWHKESEQWLLNLKTGKARPLDEINSNEADSYHNWNVNSRWIVFTSRRINGLYSQLFLTSIDENGQATKPFLLPQENPLKYYDETLYSFNTPDFTKSKVSFDNLSAYREIASDIRTETKVKTHIIKP